MALILTLCLAAPALDATEKADKPASDNEAAKTTEPETDGDEEATEKKKKGPSFIAIPIIITEPAIGYGFGGAVAHFHKKKHEADPDAGSHPPALTADTAAKAGKQQKAPPTISGFAAAYTEDGTWGVGFAHTASWKKDRIRYTGAVGYAHVVSSFYFNDQPAEFKFDTGLFYQDVKFRIGSGDIFVGGKLVYLTPDLLFDEDSGELPVEGDRTKLNDFGLAVQADYDARDNKFTPNRGLDVEFVAWKHLEVLGGDTDYWQVSFLVDSYHEMLNKKLVLGLHLDLDTAGGDPPLWGYPWVTMRGIPALRYQNESTAVIETELRWNIFGRWAAVGFIGAAATRGDVLVFEDESGIYAGGAGGRFLFRPQDSLWVGIDVARGPEDTALYVVMGHKW
ncbi:MAG: outer membrane protein assembly factor [Acidobacteriota bacterium]|jgi:hypothetical protein|nr:outer membrane protein assembly factor [Acidobacteriota bacterium]